jgi:hypothetical protein
MATDMRRVVMVAATAAMLSTPVLAQSPDARWFLSVGGGVQSVSGKLSDHIETPRDVETETVDVKYSLKPNLLVDAGLGVRLWKRLGAGVAVSRATGTHTADIEASIPHPFFFTRPRAISGTEDGIVRNETGVHLQLQYSLRAGRRATVVLGAGPSWIEVEQELVTAVKFDQTYPYDEATFTGAVTDRSKRSAVGFNAGADVRWMLARHLGLGGTVRFTRADVDLPAREASHIAVKAGGIQAAAGLRLAF